MDLSFIHQANWEGCSAQQYDQKQARSKAEIIRNKRSGVERVRKHRATSRPAGMLAVDVEAFRKRQRSAQCNPLRHVARTRRYKRPEDESVLVCKPKWPIRDWP